jgi:ApeA N-terminal domain 1
MMRAFEHIGFWWDPREPATRWPGTLKFDPVAGATLSLTIPSDASHIFDARREFEVLHGTTTGAVEITLLDCFERSGTEVFANAVIVGFHAEQADPSVLVVAATVENLADWWGQNALAHEPSLKYPDVGVRYTQPPATDIHADAIIRTSICSSPLASFEHRRISVGEDIRIELTASEPQPLSVFRRRIHAFQDLLSIASLTLCNLEELRLCPPSDGGRPKVVGKFYAVPVFKNPAEGWPNFLFQYKDIATRGIDVFDAWFSKADSLGAVRSLYISGAYGKSFLELKLLSLAQACEAYHRRVYEGRDMYRDGNDYRDKVLPGLLAAIPIDLDDSHRQSLKNRLAFGNEFSFRKRLTMLIEEHEAALRTVIASPREWIERIVNYPSVDTQNRQLIDTSKPAIN